MPRHSTKASDATVRSSLNAPDPLRKTRLAARMVVDSDSVCLKKVTTRKLKQALRKEQAKFDRDVEMNDAAKTLLSEAKVKSEEIPQSVVGTERETTAYLNHLLALDSIPSTNSTSHPALHHPHPAPFTGDNHATIIPLEMRAILDQAQADSDAACWALLNELDNMPVADDDKAQDPSPQSHTPSYLNHPSSTSTPTSVGVRIRNIKQRAPSSLSASRWAPSDSRDVAPKSPPIASTLRRYDTTVPNVARREPTSSEPLRKRTRDDLDDAKSDDEEPAHKRSRQARSQTPDPESKRVDTPASKDWTRRGSTPGPETLKVENSRGETPEPEDRHEAVTPPPSPLTIASSSTQKTKWVDTRPAFHVMKWPINAPLPPVYNVFLDVIPPSEPGTPRRGWAVHPRTAKWMEKLTSMGLDPVNLAVEKIYKAADAAKYTGDHFVVPGQIQSQ